MSPPANSRKIVSKFLTKKIEKKLFVLFFILFVANSLMNRASKVLSIIEQF